MEKNYERHIKTARLYKKLKAKGEKGEHQNKI